MGNSNQVTCTKINEVYMRVDCESDIFQLAHNHFSFEVPGAKFMPSYRKKYWDGKIRLLNSKNKLMYIGLFEKLKQFCEFNNYEVIDSECSGVSNNISPEDLKDFFDSLPLTKFPRDYQLRAFTSAIQSNRLVLLSPTGSGKSLIIYLLCEWYAQFGHRVLVIVPTINLVHQLRSDFIAYNPKVENKVLSIHGGIEKKSKVPFTISTWQSIYDIEDDFFSQFDVVIGDECHQYKAKALQSLMEKTKNCVYKFGTTGTLDDVECNQLILQGLFGNIEKVISTTELIDSKVLAELEIKCFCFKHTETDAKYISKCTYQEEIEFLVMHQKRNDKLCRLVQSLEGNTLVLFQFVEKQGKELYQKIKDICIDRKVFFIYGGVEGEERELIRGIVEKEIKSVIVVSYGCVSTGINIQNLNNIVFASPSNSKIRVLQSIGRGLRTSSTKQTCTLYDIGDDFRHKQHVNFTFKHFQNRIQLYAQEGFNYKLYNLDI